MTGLNELVGRERSLREVAQTLYFTGRTMQAPVVGAIHVTCSDESEMECVEAFQQGFVQYLLPSLKFARQSAFRTSNLGGRYEWSAVRLAEAHFAAPLETSAGKLLVVKINAHVACQEEPIAAAAHPSAERTFRLGSWSRYGRESPCCGALNALMNGGLAPQMEDLQEIFASEGKDRLEALRDPARVEPGFAPLYAAIVSARLQARKAVLDIQDYTPDSPTYFVVLPSVTINRHERDTEIVCGVYSIDGRQGGRDATYTGLGDDPSAYTCRVVNRQMEIGDEQLGQLRKGRDHRAIAYATLRGRLAERPIEIRDERLQRVRNDVAQNKHRHHSHARTLLRIALPVLAEVAPVPAAILAFAEGAAGIHHAFRVHRLAASMQGDADARQILDELHGRIDSMEGDKAEALIELLMREYRA